MMLKLDAGNKRTRCEREVGEKSTDAEDEDR